MTQMRISTVAIRKGSNTELQQLLTLLDLICKLTNLQWNKDLMKILHQCKEAAGLEEASLCERDEVRSHASAIGSGGAAWQ